MPLILVALSGGIKAPSRPGIVSLTKQQYCRGSNVKKVVISERKMEERKRSSSLYQFLIRAEREKQDAVLWHDISMQDAEGRLYIYI